MDRAIRSIVMFTPDLQIDRRILLEAESLINDGWCVRVVAMAAQSDIIEDPPFVTRIVNNATDQITKDSFIAVLNRMASKVFPRNGKILQFVKSLVWKYIRNPQSYYLCVFSEAVQNMRADVYVAHDLPMLPVAFAAVKLHGGKVVYDSHELFTEQEITGWEKETWIAIEREYIARCDLVITVNESIARELESRYNIDEVTVLRNCEAVSGEVETSRKLFHNHFVLPANALVLLFQGGLSKGRNLENLVRAMSYVQIPELHLVILGDGEVGDELQSLSRSLKVNDRVHFHPAVSQKELLHYTASADVGIIPYQATCLNNYYCTPNKMFEFIAAGIPVLASDLPEIRRIVTGHEIGLVADISSAENMASVVNQFCSDREQIGVFRQAVANARKKINWACESTILVKRYREL